MKRRRSNMGEVYDFTDVISEVETTADGSAGILQSFRDKFTNAVALLDMHIGTMEQRYQELLALESVAMGDAALSVQYAAEIEKMGDAMALIESARAATNQINSWWQSIKSAVGLSGARSLGALVVIPWALLATITAASLAIVAIIRSSTGLINTLAIKQWNDTNAALVAQGLPPQPANTMPQPLDAGVFGEIGSTAKWIAVALAAWFILPTLLRKNETAK